MIPRRGESHDSKEGSGSAKATDHSVIAYIEENKVEFGVKPSGNFDMIPRARIGDRFAVVLDGEQNMIVGTSKRNFKRES